MIFQSFPSAPYEFWLFFFSAPAGQPFVPGTYESSREVLPDNSAKIPSVTKFDLGARYETKSSTGTLWTLRAGIDNVFDRRAWRESPYQFSHAYLFRV